jgi:hypothetical protein
MKDKKAMPPTIDKVDLIATMAQACYEADTAKGQNWTTDDKGFMSYGGVHF